MKMHSLLALLLTPLAFATSFYIRPFSEFTKTSANIIRGKLNSIHAENGVTSDGGKTIYTFANLEIKEVVKGPITGTQIKIRKLGGTKDGVTLEIPSSVEFKEGEDSVFFLSEEREDHSYEVNGMELGKFGLKEEKGEEILTGGLFGYAHPYDKQSTDTGHAENLKPWSITQVKELVRSQVNDSPINSTSPVHHDPSKVPDQKQKTAEISNTSAIPSLNPIPNSSLVEEKDNSPLYFEPSFWYSLAIVTMTLGVFYYVRKKRG